MSENVLSSLAILKVNWDRGHDYIENFVPFIAEALRTLPQEAVALEDLQQKVEKDFGLRIPQAALQTILKKAIHYGYVRAERRVYVKNAEVLAKLNIAQIRDDVLRQQEALVGKLVQFCADKYNVAWTPESAGNALLTYLDQHSIPVLSAAIEGGTIKPAGGEVQHAGFLVNAFVAHLHQSDPAGFEYLETLVKGRMLADALLFPEIGNVGQRFDEVELYLDTPLVLRALGLSGQGLQRAARETLDLLYEQNANLRIFEHTKDEILGILEPAAKRMRRHGALEQGYGEVLEFLLSSNYTSSDVELIIAKLDDSLRALRIRVKAKPEHEKKYGLDESKLEGHLQEAVHYQRREALLRDLDSLTATYRLRKGDTFEKIELCRAIFVTDNSSLARASHEFFRTECSSRESVPHCLLDHAIGTIAWLKRPLEASTLPRNRIIANCYAALNPSDALWRKYLAEMARLRQAGTITANDYALLRFSTGARAALMELTLGDPNVFAEGSVAEVLQRARAAVRADLEVELEVGVVHRNELQNELEKFRGATAAKEAARSARLDEIATAVGRISSWALAAAVLVLLAGGAYAALPKPFPQPSERWMRYLSPVALTVAMIWTLVNWWTGTTVKGARRKVELWVASKFLSGLKNVFEPKADS